VAVEGHLVGRRRLGDGIDPDGADAVAIKEIARRPDDALAWRLRLLSRRSWRRV
jgi:hypothetical protein